MWVLWVSQVGTHYWNLPYFLLLQPFFAKSDVELNRRRANFWSIYSTYFALECRRGCRVSKTCSEGWIISPNYNIYLLLTICFMIFLVHMQIIFKKGQRHGLKYNQTLDTDLLRNSNIKGRLKRVLIITQRRIFKTGSIFEPALVSLDLGSIVVE